MRVCMRKCKREALAMQWHSLFTFNGWQVSFSHTTTLFVCLSVNIQTIIEKKIIFIEHSASIFSFFTNVFICCRFSNFLLVCVVAHKMQNYLSFYCMQKENNNGNINSSASIAMYWCCYWLDVEKTIITVIINSSGSGSNSKRIAKTISIR